MKIILASGNKGKIREIASYCTDHEVLPYSDIIEKFDVIDLQFGPDFLCIQEVLHL